jgi:small subunit ribosomal protein S8
MNITDPIADLLMRIRNAIQARHQNVEIPASGLKVEIVRILKEQHLISGYKLTAGAGPGTGRISVALRYDSQGRPAINSLRRVSRPGCRVYLKRKATVPVLNGFGISIASTSRGIMTGADAVQAGVGGEILCNVY